jgi:hypothetical protein
MIIDAYSVKYLECNAKTREWLVADMLGNNRMIVYAVDRADAELIAERKTGVAMFAEPNW